MYNIIRNASNDGYKIINLALLYWRKQRNSVSPLTYGIGELCLCLDPGS